MKIPLDVRERLLVQGLLPEKGNFLNLKRVRKLREALSFTTEEVEKYGLKINQDGKGVAWEVNEDAEIDFDPELFVVVKNKLTEMNDSDSLTPEHLSLYEKFVADSTALKVVE